VRGHRERPLRCAGEDIAGARHVHVLRRRRQVGVGRRAVDVGDEDIDDRRTEPPLDGRAMARAYGTLTRVDQAMRTPG